MIDSLLSLFEHYGLPGMFLSILLENLGLPFPTEPAYLVGQSLADRDRYPYWIVVSTLVSAHVLGSWLSYSAGRKISRRLQEGHRLNEIQQKLHDWYGRYGLITVFVSRLLGHLRPWSSYVAGVAEVPPVPFLVLTFLGSLLFTVLSLMLSQTLLNLWHYSPVVRILISASFFLGFLGLVYFSLRKKQGQNRLQET